MGHGADLILSNGYSWSHSKKEDNMDFTTNDIIICEYDPNKKYNKII
jgi:hypothetical protein